ncbi:MAG: hypothetical protein LBV54_07160 [Puniceicoccales bacterium]|jgi:hypothetical protein|nr:hypothetical protein [Puniceicoccales bacterium]
MRLISSILLFAAALVLCGCSSFESRAREHNATFTALPTATQERLRSGDVALGDTPEMVYLAWGEPDRKSTRKNAAGISEQWLYYQHHVQYSTGVVFGGGPRFFRGPGGRAVFVSPSTTWVDYYETGDSLWRQVTFSDGKVTEVLR